MIKINILGLIALVSAIALTYLADIMFQDLSSHTEGFIFASCMIILDFGYRYFVVKPKLQSRYDQHKHLGIFKIDSKLIWFASPSGPIVAFFPPYVPGFIFGGFVIISKILSHAA